MPGQGIYPSDWIEIDRARKKRELLDKSIQAQASQKDSAERRWEIGQAEKLHQMTTGAHEFIRDTPPSEWGPDRGKYNPLDHFGHISPPVTMDESDQARGIEAGYADATYDETTAIMAAYDAPAIAGGLYQLGRYGLMHGGRAASNFRSLIDDIKSAGDLNLSGLGMPTRLGGRSSGALPHGSRAAVESKTMSSMDWPGAGPSVTAADDPMRVFRQRAFPGDTPSPTHRGGASQNIEFITDPTAPGGFRLGERTGSLDELFPHGTLEEVTGGWHTNLGGGAVGSKNSEGLISNKVDELLAIKTGLREAPPAGTPGYWEQLAEKVIYSPNTAGGYNTARDTFLVKAKNFVPESIPGRTESPKAVLGHIIKIEHSPGSQDTIRVAAAYLDEILEEMAEHRLRQSIGPTGKFPNTVDDLTNNMSSSLTIEGDLAERSASIIKDVQPPSTGQSTLFSDIAEQAPDARRVSMPTSKSQDVRREMINAIADNLSEDDAMKVLMTQAERPNMTMREVAEMADELFASQGGASGPGSSGFLDDLVRQSDPTEAHSDAIHLAIERAKKRVDLGDAENVMTETNRLQQNYDTDALRTISEVGVPRSLIISEGMDPTNASMLGPMDEVFGAASDIANDGVMSTVPRWFSGRVPPPSMNAIVPAAVGAETLDLIDNMSEE